MSDDSTPSASGPQLSQRHLNHSMGSTTQSVPSYLITPESPPTEIDLDNDGFIPTPAVQISLKSDKRDDIADPNVGWPHGWSAGRHLKPIRVRNKSRHNFKRRRSEITPCDRCREMKIVCNVRRPCRNCEKHGSSCQSIANYSGVLLLQRSDEGNFLDAVSSGSSGSVAGIMNSQSQHFKRAPVFQLGDQSDELLSEKAAPRAPTGSESSEISRNVLAMGRVNTPSLDLDQKMLRVDNAAISEHEICSDQERSDFFWFSEDIASSPESSDISKTIFKDELLEEHLTKWFNQNAAFAQSLKARLIDKITFILPLFNGEECKRIFDVSGFTRFIANETDSSQSSNSSTSPAQSASTSLSSKPTTSTCLKKGLSGAGRNDQSQDDGEPSAKRRKAGISQSLRNLGRLRFRCHFHACYPNMHTRKTCVTSGWLTIHNLRGHYDSHHTVIRCNKCFQEFSMKTEKNVHSRACRRMTNPPNIDVIDCDKSDEIDERIKPLRTWKLDDEQDDEMKSWIIKYKAKLEHDKDGSRELAKWYIYWRTLFPFYKGVVPSPFFNSIISPQNLGLEQWLQIFQSLVETKIEHDMPPPTEPSEQIEYYKDIVREVYEFTQHTTATRSQERQKSLAFSNQSEAPLKSISPKPLDTVLSDDMSGSAAAQFASSRTEAAAGPSEYHLSMPIEDPFAIARPAPPQACHSLIPSVCSDSAFDADRTAEIAAQGQLWTSSHLRAIQSCEGSSSVDRGVNASLEDNSLEAKFSQHVQSEANASWRYGQTMEGGEFSCRWCMDSGYVDLGAEIQTCFLCNSELNAGK